MTIRILGARHPRRCIGAKATILKGIELGDGCVVGAGAVVLAASRLQRDCGRAGALDKPGPTQSFLT